MSDKYILINKKPVKEKDLLTWARRFEKANRQVAYDVFPSNNENIRVSTVFLGIDHNFSGTGKPILFETMIFGGKHDGYQERYSTWKEAVKGHTKALEKLKDKT